MSDSNNDTALGPLWATGHAGTYILHHRIGIYAACATSSCIVVRSGEAKVGAAYRAAY